MTEARASLRLQPMWRKFRTYLRKQPCRWRFKRLEKAFHIHLDTFVPNHNRITVAHRKLSPIDTVAHFNHTFTCLHWPTHCIIYPADNQRMKHFFFFLNVLRNILSLPLSRVIKNFVTCVRVRKTDINITSFTGKLLRLHVVPSDSNSVPK